MMDERERRDIMLRAIHRYGEAAQIDMAVEEMAELTKALCKVKRATPGATTTAAIANVIEEIATSRSCSTSSGSYLPAAPTRSRRKNCAGCSAGSTATQSPTFTNG